MIWYWYFARPNELLLDLDSDARLLRAMDNLARAVRIGFLEVKHAYVAESSPGKYHCFVTLKKPMHALEKVIWQMWLGSDIVREEYNLYRILKKVPNPNLLIRKSGNIMGRVSDAVCFCREKHKWQRITKHCPVLTAHHGDERSKAYFPLRKGSKKRKIKVLLTTRLTPSAIIGMSKPQRKTK